MRPAARLFSEKFQDPAVTLGIRVANAFACHIRLLEKHQFPEGIRPHSFRQTAKLPGIRLERDHVV